MPQTNDLDGTTRSFFLVTDEEVLTLRADHVVGLHRGLLFVLVLTIITMLPAIVWGGSNGRSWIEGDHGVRVFTVPADLSSSRSTDPVRGVGVAWDMSAARTDRTAR